MRRRRLHAHPHRLRGVLGVARRIPGTAGLARPLQLVSDVSGQHVPASARVDAQAFTGCRQLQQRPALVVSYHSTLLLPRATCDDMEAPG